MRWPEEQRMNFIGERLREAGRINRGDLQTKFGVSPAQAAIDFARFLQHWPESMRYDRSAKCYRAKDPPSQEQMGCTVTVELDTWASDEEPPKRERAPDPRQLTPPELVLIAKRLNDPPPRKGLSIAPWYAQLEIDAKALLAHVEFLEEMEMQRA